MSLDAEIKALVELQGRTISDFARRGDERMRALEARVGALAGLEERADRIETALRRTGGGTVETKGGERPIEVKAFEGYIRRGAEALEAGERKALSVGTDPAGGYLAPAQMEAELLRNIVELSPLRRLANVKTGSGPALITPRRVASISAQWTAEMQETSLSQPSFGQLEVVAHSITASTEITTQLLEDAGVDIETELATEFAEQFATTEGTAFATGNGVGRPRGFLTYDAGTGDGQVEQVPTGSATEVTADSLVKLLYSLKTAYRRGAVWLMNRRTIGTIRSFKTGDGTYLWSELGGQLIPGQPDRLLGLPVEEDPSMPDIAAGALPIALADWRRAYRIFDRRGLQVLRDPYTKARSGLVVMTASRRVGGGVQIPEAIKLLRVAAS